MESRENDLDNFRNEWKDEIQQSLLKSRDEKGKQLYQQGVELERRGFCYEAIEYYRQACKLVPDIEQRLDMVICDSQNTASGEEYEFEDQPQISQEDLIGTVSNTDELNFEEDCCSPLQATKTTHISRLPTEILYLILRYVVSHELDMKSLENFSMVCRWFYRLARSPIIWRAACEKFWPDSGSQLLQKYGNWRAMYITNPHIRFDGIYISRIKYYRQGEQTPRLCCTWQTVIYHRFFRFFPEGLVLALNTTLPPQHCVSILKDRNPLKRDGMRIMCGTYKVTGSTIKMTLLYREGPAKVRGDNSFNIALKLSSRNGRQSLTWEEYSVISKNQVTGNVSQNDIDLEPPHFCKFTFGRVKSYTAQSGGKL